MNEECMDIKHIIIDVKSAIIIKKDRSGFRGSITIVCHMVGVALVLVVVVVVVYLCPIHPDRMRSHSQPRSLCLCLSLDLTPSQYPGTFPLPSNSMG